MFEYEQTLEVVENKIYLDAETGWLLTYAKGCIVVLLKAPFKILKKLK